MFVKIYITTTVFLLALVAILSATGQTSADSVELSLFQQFLKYKSPNAQTAQADLTSDSTPEEYSLTNGVLTITQDAQELWVSSPDWWIDSFDIADATHDGTTNLVVSLWKSGNYGPSKPFWIEENDPSVRNHLFVMEYNNGEFVQVWGSSNLSVPNCEFSFSDIDNDGKQELVVVEGEYTEDFSCTGKYRAIWKWNEWGFYNESRSDFIS